MRYLQSGSFSVQVGTREAQKNYRNNWERIFGKSKPQPAKTKPDETNTVAAR